MRRIEIVVARSAGLLPTIAAAALLPLGTVAGCGSEVTAGSSSTATGTGGGVGAGGTGAGGGLSTGGAGGTGSTTTSSGGFGGAAPITCPYGETTFVVQIPPEGVAATAEALCAAPEPVESNLAGRITLNKYSQALNLATGLLSVAPDLVVVGTPTIEVVDAGYAELLGPNVTNVVPTAGGFTFHVEWPSPFALNPDEWARMIMRATMSVQCADNTSTLVQSQTFINLCVEQGEALWVSSGDECTACSQVCEMAPGPTLAGAARGMRALSRAVKLALVEVARVGRSVIVLAEHDGGPGLRYRWAAAGGQLTHLAPDLVLWTLPEKANDRHLRVAAVGSDCVAAAGLHVG